MAFDKGENGGDCRDYLPSTINSVSRVLSQAGKYCMYLLSISRDSGILRGPVTSLVSQLSVSRKRRCATDLGKAATADRVTSLHRTSPLSLGRHAALLHSAPGEHQLRKLSSLDTLVLTASLFSCCGSFDLLFLLYRRPTKTSDGFAYV